MKHDGYILIVNAGSSSIKFDVFAASPRRLHKATVRLIGQPGTTFVDGSEENPVSAQDHRQALGLLLDWFKELYPDGPPMAIGHRVVHGGPDYFESCLATPPVLSGLRELIALDRLHMPAQLDAIALLQGQFPDIPHVLAFDTGFHQGLPEVARTLPLPPKITGRTVRRYGFHGLSYRYLLSEMQHLDPEAANGRLIFAHLGSGVSLGAVNKGKSIDTTMGFSPTGGVPMSARSGDLDPSIITYLMRRDGLDAEALDQLVNDQSGLVGLGHSADMKTLLDHETDDPAAATAINFFCYQIRKAIGGLAAALGGVDQLVFTGGIGEQAPKIRDRVCQNLEFLGISLDQTHNNANAGLISAPDSRTPVRVIPTDEAAIIAHDVHDLLSEEPRHEHELPAAKS